MKLTPLTLLALSLQLMICLVAQTAMPTFEIAQQDGRLVKLTIALQAMPLQEHGGGFHVFDFHTKKTLDLNNSQIARRADGGRTFRAETDGLTLQADYTPQADGSVRVRGLLGSSTGQDRAIILRYVVPLHAPDSLFDYDPGDSQRIGTGKQAIGTIFPVAAMTAGKACAAIAIPPSFPCCFGMSGTPEGLGVEFYLGIVPETRHFPNQARFEFLIYGAQAAWPFRSALARYYELFSDYYAPRIKGGGFWNKHEPGNIDAALPTYRFQVVDRAELKRDKRPSLLSFYYLLVGQRSIRDLPELPTTYAAAMKVYEQFTRQWSQKAGEPGEASALATPELIEHCACKDADGHYVLHKIKKGGSTAEGDTGIVAGKAEEHAKRAKRDTAERGGAGAKNNSLTFLVNPNPDLFAERGWSTVGGLTIHAALALLNSEPVDGFEFDSLGGRWPATLNFRRDHFAYARYPLCFDERGRVALHNCISHYECIETLRALTRQRGKLLFGNGIYTYARQPGSDKYEHYNSQQNGRFFPAALLDVLGRENSELFGRQDLERMRAMAGRKLYTMVMYQWKDVKLVRDQMNRNLAYAVFGTPSDKDKGYVVSEAYARDRELIRWFLSNCRLLHDAGWEPVTEARVNSADVGCERYGSGGTVYFALVNFAEATRDCQLTINLDSLGMLPRQGGRVELREIARNAKITEKAEGAQRHVGLRLTPNEAQIIEVRRVGS